MSLIPGAQTIHPRTSWQNPAWPVTGPLDNPANNDTIVIHYTAADDLIDGDPGEHIEDMDAYMRSMQYAYAKPKSQGGRGYSLGYSWAVDYLGGIWQIRGWEFQSAANLGHNDHTLPILVLVDGNDPATDLAARSIRLIVAEAQRRSGRTMAIKGHGQLREETGVGTATSCPGTGLKTQIKAGVFVPTLQPPTTPEEDDTVLVGFIKHASHNAVYKQWSNGTKTWVRDPGTFEVEAFLRGKSVAQLYADVKTMPNNSWMQAAGPIVGPVPAGVDGWGCPK